jgi:hypothetical protein
MGNADAQCCEYPRPRARLAGHVSRNLIHTPYTQFRGSRRTPGGRISAQRRSSVASGSLRRRGSRSSARRDEISHPTAPCMRRIKNFSSSIVWLLSERPGAHLCETAPLRRVHVRRHENMLKRLLVHASAFILILLMRGCSRSACRCASGPRGGRLAVLKRLWNPVSELVRRCRRGSSRQSV